MRRSTIFYRFALAASIFVILATLLLKWGSPALSPLLQYIQDVESRDLTHYVNPFIGTAPSPGANNGFGFDTGDVVPAAIYPAGMLQWGPDTSTNIAGHYYYPDHLIKGFSLTHFSGRGCVAYGDIPFMPYSGTSASPAPFSHSSEVAQPGYYSVHLDNSGIVVELAAAAHSGIAQFTYPFGSQASLQINAHGSAKGNSSAFVQVDSNREISGKATSLVGCGNASYTIYFVARFDQPFRQSTNDSSTAINLTFDTSNSHVIHAQVGISYISVDGARNNLNTEIGNASFEQVKEAASAAWNDHLHSIVVSGGTEDEKTSFYTALYHSFIHPNVFNDVDGRYLGFDGKVHTLAAGQHAQYENIAGWDQYRTLMRLLSIIMPTEASDIAQSLVNDAQQGDGHLPRWEQVNVDSHGMNGDSADVEIATAYAFGATNFDTAAALHAMLTGQAKIREGLRNYVKLGYVAAGTDPNSVFITEEYAIDDFAIAQFAQSLGKRDIYTTYMQRSQNWQNVLNTSSGYMQPRQHDGTWVSGFSPTGGSGFTESDSAQDTWMVPFDLPGLFAKLGGNATVVARLDTFFKHLNAGARSKYAFIGNEPSLEVPWEYDFAGAPSHTQQVVRRSELQLFTNSAGGLPGNDDGGTTSAWYIFAATGLYPEIPAIGGFVLGSPLFNTVNIRLAGGKSIQINAPAAADNAPYVQGFHLNGRASSSLWIDWNSVKNGATLDFALGTQPAQWGSRAIDAPPSFAITT